MCGIIGGYNTTGLSKTDFQLANDTIFHRGPDSEGVFHADQVTLGMRRLKIIDLHTGDQPIFNEDKTVAIVFNGEIYNFQELKKELVAKGHTFTTNTDTEVIVHLYEDFGTQCVTHLRGMFAFALWDVKKQQLFIARDRLGIKPLYYSTQNDSLIFASELKSILTIPTIKKQMDMNAVNEYFALSYIPAPKTIYQDIFKLPPAHILVANSSGIKVSRYWDVDFTQNPSLSEDECIEGLIYRLDEAVKLRMISDVPLGAMLSGGVDSSLLVALMSRHTDQVKTFSVGYDDSVFDEREYAQMVADQYNTEHHEIMLDPSNIPDLITKTVRCFDEPFSNASAIPNYLISKEISNHVTVILSGLGGDEICAGYERYLGGIISGKYSQLPNPVTSIIRSGINKLKDSSNGGHTVGRLKRFVNNANLPLQQQYLNIISKFNSEERHQLLGAKHEFQLRQPPEGLDTLSQMLFWDTNHYLSDELLTISDRTTSAHSLEGRVPLIDHKVVELMATYPSKMKIKGFNKKYLLKKVAERYLPKELIYRKKKGFSVPLSQWLREGECLTFARDTVSTSDMFDSTYVNQLFDDHVKLRANNSEKLWALTNFATWQTLYEA